MTRITPLAAILSVSLVAPVTLAQEAPAAYQDSPGERPWSLSAEVGAIATSGNTETTTIQGKIDAEHDMERWNNQYTLSVLFKEDEIPQGDGTTETVKTAERFSGSAQSAYKLTRDHDNLFVAVSHVDDEFAAYSKYTTFAIGYGTRLYDADTMQLDVEIGPGYYWADQVLEDDTVVSEKGAFGRGALQFDWQVSENADFKQTLSVEVADENTRINSDTSLSTRINDAMQMKVGYTVTSDSDVSPGMEATDTTTYINLVYKF